MRRPVLRVVLLCALVVGGVLVARLTPVGDEVHRLAARLAAEARRPWAAPAYVAFYGAALAVGLPGTVLTLIGGAAFGAALGLGAAIAVNLAGALLGATLAFLEGRYLARDAVRALFGHHLERLSDLSRPRRAIWAFFRLRMIPLVPFNGLNFAAGLTETRLGPYLVGTLLGIIPSTTVYTMFAAELGRGDAAWWILLSLVAFGLVGLAPTLWQLAQRRVKSPDGSHRAGRGPFSGAAGPRLPGSRDA
jgi:uncharacterized membrane protein YdjX (TVP38/TMEM64 family)